MIKCSLNVRIRRKFSCGNLINCFRVNSTVNTQKNINFLRKPLCPSFTQLLIKFSKMNFLRVDVEFSHVELIYVKLTSS